MRLIDADALYEKLLESEELARGRVRDTESTFPHPIWTTLNPAYTRYLAQMDERVRARRMVESAPTVDAVPVVRCKDCRYYKRDNHKCEVFRAIVCDNFYCKDGERKDGDGNG